MAWHAKLSASSAHRWMVCPGSVRESEGLPNTTSEYAAEGTVAHDIAAMCIGNAALLPHNFLGEVRELDGYKIEVTPDMVEAVWTYINYVDSRVADVGDNNFKKHVEVDLTPAMNQLDSELGGTSDLILWFPESKVLEAADYKHGAGKLVGVEDNKQLMYYALGAMVAFPSYKPETVRITVVQPRCGLDSGVESIRSYEYHAADLLDFEADLLEAANATRVLDAPLVPGPSQCQWCLAKPRCPALQQAQSDLMAAEFEVIEPGTQLVTIDERPKPTLGQMLDMADLVELRIKALREYAYDQAMHGNPPDGHKLVEKRARRYWTQEAKDTLELLVDDVYEQPKMKSPAQVEKALGKKKFKELLGDLTDTASSGYTLVKESDKRESANLRIADADEMQALTEDSN